MTLQKKIPKAPILLIAYNRISPLASTIEAIQSAGSREIFVSVDGPKAGDKEDEMRCTSVRQLIMDKFDLAPTNYKFANSNLGLKLNIESSLEWVFSKRDRAIILEDDCIPDPSFFDFCDEMLEDYALDDSIGMVQGGNFLRGAAEAMPESYYFSYRPKIWGWATWRRVHELHDPNINFWTQPGFDKLGFVRSFGYSKKDAKKYAKKVDSAKDIGTWDYQWVVNLWRRGQVSIVPKVNLVRNDGFGSMATHTLFESFSESVPIYSLEFPLSHPEKITPRTDLDVLEKKMRANVWFRFALHNPIQLIGKMIRYLVLRIRRIF